jgi:hypothetical protein
MVSSSNKAAIVTLTIMLMPNEPIRPSGSGSSPNVPRFSELSVAIAQFLQHHLRKEVATVNQCTRAAMHFDDQ